MDDELVGLYHKIISSNTARRIIVLLGESNQRRATDLINALGISPGTFYDSLKKLKGIVEKTNDGRYQLTESGRKIYYYLINESKGFQQPFSLLSALSSFSFLFPYNLIRRLGNLNLPLLISIAAAITVIGVIGSIMSRTIPVGFLLMPTYVLLQPQFQAIFFLINLLFTISITYFFGNLFGKINNSLKFSLLVIVSFIPLIIFSFIYYIFYQTFFISLHITYYLLIIIAFMFFSFMILTSIFFVMSSLGIETSIIISLIVLLLSFIGSEILINSIL